MEILQNTEHDDVEKIRQTFLFLLVQVAQAPMLRMISFTSHGTSRRHKSKVVGMNIEFLRLSVERELSERHAIKGFLTRKNCIALFEVAAENVIRVSQGVSCSCFASERNLGSNDVSFMTLQCI